MCCNVWDKITYPFSNFHGGIVEVWEWISYFTPHFTEHVITYTCWDQRQAILAKLGPADRKWVVNHQRCHLIFRYEIIAFKTTRILFLYKALMLLLFCMEMWHYCNVLVSSYLDEYGPYTLVSLYSKLKVSFNGNGLSWQVKQIYFIRITSFSNPISIEY